MDSGGKVSHLRWRGRSSTAPARQGARKHVTGERWIKRKKMKKLLGQARKSRKRKRAKGELSKHWEVIWPKNHIKSHCNNTWILEFE